MLSVTLSVPRTYEEGIFFAGTWSFVKEMADESIKKLQEVTYTIPSYRFERTTQLRIP